MKQLNAQEKILDYKQRTLNLSVFLFGGLAIDTQKLLLYYLVVEFIRYIW